MEQGGCARPMGKTVLQFTNTPFAAHIASVAARRQWAPIAEAKRLN